LSTTWLYLERLLDTWNVDSPQFEHRLYTWSHGTAYSDSLPRRYHFAILSSIHHVEFVYTEFITLRIPAPSQPTCTSKQLPVHRLYTALFSQVGNTFFSTVQIPTRRPNVLNQAFVCLQPPRWKLRRVKIHLKFFHDHFPAAIFSIVALVSCVPLGRDGCPNAWYFVSPVNVFQHGTETERSNTPPPRVAEATVATKFVVSRGAFRITLQRKYLQSPSSHSLTTWQCCFESLHCANYRP